MKISHFTDFLPDETVYSVACRYFDRMQFRSYSIVSQHLFGGQTNGVVTDLPSSLEHLIQALPPYHRYTADIIIDQHTLFPLYAPFLSFERSSILRHRMKAGSPAVHWIAGITTSRVSRVQWLRYCPACVDYDRLTYGECYWHRVHQVPGVLVCPIHEIMLEDSSVNMAHGYNVAQFCSAECSVNTLPQHRVPAHLCAILVQIARNAKWLLEQPVSIDQGYVRQLYLSLLAERGLVATRGRVRYAKLKKVALDYYPADLLEKLECGIQSKENWLANWTVIRHPLHHLLFIQLLCETTQEFFTKPHPTSAPFGNGPWPCLNPLCSHFQERVITSYTLRHSPLNRPIATFACLCGFKYSRSGPDIDDEASFRIGAISQYGDVWDQQLTTYWLDPKIPTSQIACLMHVSTKTVQRQAARLGLPFAPDIPRRGKRPKIHQDSINEQRDTYRALWEETRKSLSDAEVKKTVKAPSQAYYWLWEHDREWLKEHYTSGGLSLRNEQLLQSRIQMLRNHYSQVDADLAKAVMETAEEIRARSDFPIRITRQLLVVQLSNNLLKKSNAFNILPLTSHALEKAIETSPAFIWRKLQWTVRSCLEEQIVPPYHVFLRRARTDDATSAHPFLRQLGQIAYHSLCTGTLLSNQMPEGSVEVEKRGLSGNENGRSVTYNSLAAACTGKQLMLSNVIVRPMRQEYDLVPILLLTTAAVVNGAQNNGAVARWGYQNPELLRWFGLPEDKFPAKSTLRKIYAKVDIDSFESILETWLHETFPLQQNKAIEVKVDTGSTYVPGLRLLRSYQYIASEVVAKLR